MKDDDLWFAYLRGAQAFREAVVHLLSGADKDAPLREVLPRVVALKIDGDRDEVLRTVRAR